MMTGKRHALNSLSVALRCLEEQGVVGKDASDTVRAKTRVLERAIATKNHRLVQKTVAEISDIIRKEVER